MPLHEALGSSGWCPARFTPPPTASFPKNSAAVSWRSLRRTPVCPSSEQPAQNCRLVLLRSVRGVPPGFPLLAQPAHGFAQTHSQCRNRFQSLFSAARKFAVTLPVNLRQQEFRVPKNSGQRIVELMTQHFAKILLRFLQWFAGAIRHRLHLV